MKERGQKTAYAAFAKQLKESAGMKFETQKALAMELERLEEAAKKAGTTLKKEGIESFKPLANMNQKQTYIIRDGIRMAEKKIKKNKEEIDAIDDTIDAHARLRTEYDKAKVQLQKLGGVVKTISKDFLKFAEQEQRFAQATATADAGWIDGLTKMGISQIEYMKILKNTRQESLAATTVGIDFKTSMQASSESLRSMTSSTVEAAQGAMGFHKNMARVGVSQDELGDAVAQQTSMYKDNYRALGYSVEEFNNLTTELINDQGMRSTLLGLQESERKQYILGIQQRQAEYMTMGYTIERAKELQKTFQALNKQNPKERMKEAAKQRAMMGAMGMGAEGGEMFDLKTRYRTMNAEDKKNAEKRMTEINAQAAKQFGAMSGSGASIGQAMSMQMMADKTGFTQVADTFETETGQGLKFAKDQLGATNEINSGISKILEAMSYWQQASESSIGSIGTTIGSTVASAVAHAVGGAVLLKGAAKMAGMGGAGGIMSGIGAGVKGAAAKAAGMGGAAGKAAAGLTKGAAKSALKAIPGIGLIAALGFMGSRLADGDVMGAGMELASGALGLLPGAGTAASIGMSGAIVARDLASNAGPQPLEPEMESSPVKNMGMSQETILVELNATMLSIREFLLTTTDANSEQAKSLDSVGKVMNETLRFNNIRDGRTS